MVRVLLPYGFFLASFWILCAEASQTAKHLQMAREALVLGEMPKWKRALQKAEEALRTELPTLPVEEGNRYQLWLYLFWTKYYQFRGIPPLIRKIREFETLSDLRSWILQTEQSAIRLKKAIFWLKRYNLLLLQISSRSNLQNQIKIQASLSLERDLENTLREVQIYQVLLLYAKENWKDRKQESSVVQRLAEQEKKLAALQITQQQAVRRAEIIKKKQKRLSKGVSLLNESFTLSHARLQRRVIAGNALIGVGIGLMALGLTGFSISIVLNTKISNDPNYPSKAAQEDALVPTFIGMASSGGVFLIGLAMVVVGPAIKPRLVERDEALLKSHQKYHEEEERDCENCTPSSSPFQPSPRSRPFVQSGVHKRSKPSPPPLVRKLRRFAILPPSPPSKNSKTSILAEVW